MKIPRHTSTEPVGAIAASLDEAGCVVVTDAWERETRDALGVYDPRLRRQSPSGTRSGGA